VIVATTDAHDSFFRNNIKEEEIENVRIIRFRNISNKLAKKCNLYLPRGFKKWAEKNVNEFDVVHLHDFFTYQNIVIARLCKKNNIPYIVQPHGALNITRIKSKFYKIKRLFIDLFSLVLNNSAAVIALTKYEKAEIENINPGIKNKIKVLPNSIDPSEFKDVKAADNYKKYGIPREHKIISFLGRLQHIKGVDISLRALAELNKDIKYSFLIVGPDEGEKENLQILAKELKIGKQVIFAGLLSGNEKWQTIKGSDLFLFSSRSEGFPMTLLEANALGVPVICTEECNLPEVETFESGFVVKEEKDLTKKIEKVLTDSNLKKHFSMNAKKLVDLFSADKNVKELISIYSAVIK
jgi:glycosyltransferase involved in cell wall biosynthesis